MTDWSEPRRCVLCGNTDHRDLRVALVHWRDGEPGMAYEHVPRCIDHDACRARVAANGELWPLVETMRKSA